MRNALAAFIVLLISGCGTSPSVGNTPVSLRTFTAIADSAAPVFAPAGAAPDLTSLAGQLLAERKYESWLEWDLLQHQGFASYSRTTTPALQTGIAWSHVYNQPTDNNPPPALLTVTGDVVTYSEPILSASPRLTELELTGTMSASEVDGLLGNLVQLPFGTNGSQDTSQSFQVHWQLAGKFDGVAFSLNCDQHCYLIFEDLLAN